MYKQQRAASLEEIEGRKAGDHYEYNSWEVHVAGGGATHGVQLDIVSASKVTGNSSSQGFRLYVRLAYNTQHPRPSRPCLSALG